MPVAAAFLMMGPDNKPEVGRIFLSYYSPSRCYVASGYNSGQCEHFLSQFSEVAFEGAKAWLLEGGRTITSVYPPAPQTQKVRVARWSGAAFLIRDRDLRAVYISDDDLESIAAVTNPKDLPQRLRTILRAGLSPQEQESIEEWLGDPTTNWVFLPADIERALDGERWDFDALEESLSGFLATHL